MLRRLAKIPTLLVVLALGFVSPLLVADALAQSARRVGYVDLQRVLVRSRAGVTARDQFEREKAAMRQDLEDRAREVDRLRDEMQKKRALLSVEARKEKQEELQRKIRDLRRLRADYESDLAKKEREVTSGMLRDVTGIIRRVGKQRGFLLIVDRRAGVIYGAPEADLTDEIIRAFDKETVKK